MALQMAISKVIYLKWWNGRAYYQEYTTQQDSFKKVKQYMSKLSLFSHSVTSDSLRPQGLQHARLFCLSPSSRACSNSCPLSWWCHPTISSSLVAFSSCLQSFPASESFPMNQFFTSGGQSIGVSASASVLSDEYSGLISFRMDLLYLLGVQGTV